MRQVRLFVILGLLSVTLAYQNCSPVSFDRPDSAEKPLNIDPFDPPDIEEDDERDPDRTCYKESFNQPKAQVIKKLDLLFVTDTSGSLNQERQRAAQGVDGFIAALPAGTDYQVGVLLAHGSTSSHSGRLYQTDNNEPKVLSSATLTQNTIRNYLEDKLTDIESDPDTDGGEMGLYSLQKSLTAPYLQANMADGFFRPGAALVVIFIADENDICARYPDGVTPVPDGQNKEGPAFIRDCANTTHVTVYDRLKNHQNGVPLLLSAIVYTDVDNVPNNGENEYGYGYMDLIQLSNGIAVDIGSNNYAAQLEAVGDLATVKLNLKVDHTLAYSPIDPTSLLVTVDDLPANYTYEALFNEVHLLEPGVAESSVLIRYCLP